ncbi:myosin C [Nitzschia inconspicua]|uniref:Myosin C n=1 Tax=Nitzschia inconspicua TaxID=303405 RepID=A0A9K3M1E5_9STRA|nr:myosin C [Nitzschia inconspicua]
MTKKKNNQVYVYILDKEFCWVPALLVEQSKEKATVVVTDYKSEIEITGSNDPPPGRSTKTVTVKLKDYPNSVLPLQNVVANNHNVKPVADMIDLSFLHEAAILYNLKARHIQSMPYTRTGDIIIAVNPYKWLNKLYSEENRTHYSRTLVWEAAKKDCDPRIDLPPHVYESSALAYKGLAISGVDQSILVSGESGAGKTETVKICMNHLASVVQQEHTVLDHDTASLDMNVITKVLDSNPLLEAFGNAKTRRNDNSSRFGKFIQLQFEQGHVNPQHLTLKGSECQVYLLEKSRVVHHDNEMERTFHIFYQLLAAPDPVKTKFWKPLQGKDNTHFRYVGPTDTHSIEGVNDSDQFEKTIQSLSLIGIDGETLKTFLQAICVVLQLGNLTFAEDGKDSDHSVIASTNELQILGTLMGISVDKLSATLTTRLVKVRHEETVVPLSPESAKESTDALAKQLYDRIFLWLVRNINEATTAGGDLESYGHIGLLDIFGFESFPVNSFEQLCINFANEALQAKFTNDVFVSVYAEYKEEGIRLEEITYDDNTHVLDLIQNRTGLLAMLNEECIRPNGSDSGFVNKALHSNSKSPALIIPRIKTSDVEFGIRHYAGDVMYDATGFVTKNQDTLPTDLMECAQSSTNEIIANEIAKTTTSACSRNAESSKGSPKRKQSNLVAPTAWTKYKSSLDHLMKNLRKSQSRYIRCVKPNSLKKPAVMEHSLTLQQLRSSGVISAVTLARSAFPNRLEHTLILNRFMFLLPSKHRNKWKSLNLHDPEDQKDASEMLLTQALEPLVGKNGVKAFVIGRSKAYFRGGALEYLESMRLKALEIPATKIQAVFRGHLARTVVERRRKKEQQEMYNFYNGRAARIQSMVRMWLAQKERDKLYVKLIKAQAKALKKQKKQKKLDNAAITIQRHLRGSYIRRRYAAVFAKLKERLSLLDKIDRIQKKVNKVKKNRKKELEQAQRGIDIDHGRDIWEASQLHIEDIELSEAAQAIELLQGEHKELQIKLKTQVAVLKPLQKNFDKLMEENKKLREDFQQAHERNERTKKANQDLITRHEDMEKQTAKLKEELANLSKMYAPAANGRLDFQMGLNDILEMIRDRCDDGELVEEVFNLGQQVHNAASEMQAEANAKYEQNVLNSPENVKRRLRSGGTPKTPNIASARSRRNILNASFGKIGSPGLGSSTGSIGKEKKKK